MTDSPTPNTPLTADDVKLLPCPFCGSKDLDRKFWASEWSQGPGCNNCGATAEDDDGWNTRRPHVPAPAGEELPPLDCAGETRRQMRRAEPGWLARSIESAKEEIARDPERHAEIAKNIGFKGDYAPPQPKGEVEAAVERLTAACGHAGTTIVKTADLRTFLSALTASQAREARADEELRAVSAALGGDARFMDPPDGGDVSLPEQVRRCRAALDETEAREARAVEALERATELLWEHVPGIAPRIEPLDATLQSLKEQKP